MTTTTATADHLVRVVELASRLGSRRPWAAVCGHCDWADMAESRQDAIALAERHREGEGR